MCLSVAIGLAQPLAWWVLVALWVLTVLLIVGHFLGWLHLPQKPKEPRGFPVITCTPGSDGKDVSSDATDGPQEEK